MSVLYLDCCISNAIQGAGRQGPQQRWASEEPHATSQEVPSLLEGGEIATFNSKICLSFSMGGIQPKNGGDTRQ